MCSPLSVQLYFSFIQQMQHCKRQQENTVHYTVGYILNISKYIFLLFKSTHYKHIVYHTIIQQ